MSTQTLTIDTTHSGIHFSVRHMVVAKVRGAFKAFGGAVQYDAQNPAASTVAVTIEAGSIDTGVAQRDGHLKGADFFDVERFPTLTFKSTKVEPAGAGALRVTGDLTIRDVTRPVVLDVEQLGTGKDPWGQTRVAFEAKTSINRTEFGLTWNQALEAGGVLVGEKIEIALEIQTVAAQATQAA
jgi:polyisoprenoid-binding protein YceI